MKGQYGTGVRLISNEVHISLSDSVAEIVNKKHLAIFTQIWDKLCNMKKPL